MTQQGKATEFHDCQEINKYQRNYTIVLYKCINNYDKRSSADYWSVGPDLSIAAWRVRLLCHTETRTTTNAPDLNRVNSHENKSHISIHFCTLFFLRVLCKYPVSMIICF